MKKQLYVLVLGLWLGTICSTVNAEMLTITNASFDDASPADWINYPTSGTGWLSSGFGGSVIDATANAPASDGGTRLGALAFNKTQAGWVSQDLGITLTAGKTYRLYADLVFALSSWDKGTANDGVGWHIHNVPYDVQLLANGTVLARENGILDFQPGDPYYRTIEVIYTAPKTDVPVGDITVKLTGPMIPAEGWKANEDSAPPSYYASLNIFYDNVRLTRVVRPPSGTLIIIQ